MIPEQKFIAYINYLRFLVERGIPFLGLSALFSIKKLTKIRQNIIGMSFLGPHLLKLENLAIK
jgi:hypothetical protein